MFMIDYGNEWERRPTTMKTATATAASGARDALRLQPIHVCSIYLLTLLMIFYIECVWPPPL